MAFIVYGESLLLSHDSGRQTSPISRGSPKVSSIKAVFVNCDGPMFQYSPIFNENNMHILQLVSIAVLVCVHVCLCMFVCMFVCLWCVTVCVRDKDRYALL